MILLIPFIVLFFFLRRNSLSRLFILIQIISLVAGIITGKKFEIDNLTDVFWVGITFAITCLIVLPYRNYIPPHNIDVINPNKISVLTKFLVLINSFIFVVFSIAAFIVQTSVTDINEFKYSEGESVDFYYSALPFPSFFFNIAILLHYFCYFLLPLHFYYLSRNRTKLALICLVLSFNVVLFGLTYFSRAILLQYTLVYLILFFFLRHTIGGSSRKLMKRVLFGFVGVIGLYFISISQSRFENNSYYSDKVPDESLVKNEQLYSYFDYLGQGLYNNHEVLKLYDGNTFSGQLTFQSLLSYLNQFGLIDYNAKAYKDLRETLWPFPYFYTFNSYTSYVIFDFGLVFGIVFSIIYLMIVKKVNPISNTIGIEKLMLVSLLIQVPIMAIFYNQIGTILLAFLIYFPINYYLKYKFKE